MRKKIDYNIHIWEINGSINIDKKFKDIIKNKLLSKYGSYKKLL